MNEVEWLTRKTRIDTRLRSLNPVWQIIPCPYINKSKFVVFDCFDDKQLAA